MHRYQDLMILFNACFSTPFNTLLVKGGDEPLYLPAGDHHPHHQLFFAHGFFSSALHECSHWLIAGEARRKQIDFGYWYAPDGRTAAQQALFQCVEVKPQAMEWILSQAASHRFRVSIDNLHGEESDTMAFKRAIYHQVKTYCEQGLSARAQQFRQALCDFYNTSMALDINTFDIDTI